MRRPWIKAEVKALRTLYPHIRTEDVAKILGRNERAIYNKAGHIGIRKSKAFKASPLSGRNVKGHAPHGVRTRFKPGHRTWNTGLKGWQAGGRSALTRFPKGHRPHNYRPIGSKRLTKDGTLQIKVTDTGYPPRDWRAAHAVLWEQHNGPIPKGHIVVFRDKRRGIGIENLECISWAENMRRNTYHNYPKPIARLIQLRGALNRQINRRLGAKQD